MRVMRDTLFGSSRCRHVALTLLLLSLAVRLSTQQPGFLGDVADAFGGVADAVGDVLDLAQGGDQTAEDVNQGAIASVLRGVHGPIGATIVPAAVYVQAAGLNAFPQEIRGGGQQQQLTARYVWTDQSRALLLWDAASRTAFLALASNATLSGGNAPPTTVPLEFADPFLSGLRADAVAVSQFNSLRAPSPSPSSSSSAAASDGLEERAGGGTGGAQPADTADESASFSSLEGGAGGGTGGAQPVDTADTADEGAGTLGGTLAEMVARGDVLRVVCSGQGAGGALAQLCGMWAALAYPFAEVDLVTFQTSWAGSSPQYNWTLAQLVQRLYLLPYQASDLARGSLSSKPDEQLLLDSTTIPVDSSNASAVPIGLHASPDVTAYEGLVDVSLNDIIDLLPIDHGDPTTGDISGTTATGEASRVFDPLGPPDTRRYGIQRRCTPLACRTLLGAVMSCQTVPEDRDGDEDEDDAIRVDDAPLFREFNESIPFGDPMGSARGGVVWLPNISTAAFVFQGTQTRKDWQNNFNLVLTDDYADQVLTKQYRDAMPGIQVHSGFWNYFDAVTLSAPEGTALQDLMYGLNGGTKPSRVICAGHSMGGGLAQLCGVWAAIQWPNASITVAPIGAPMAGNQAFAQAFRAIVGRAYRPVHMLDIVPGLPPLDSYAAVPGGMWFPPERPQQLLAQPRTGGQFDADALTWDDHSCADYARKLFNTTVSPPSWVSQL